MPGPEIHKFDWDERCKAIENAFRALPIKKFDGGIPYEFFIPGMGRQLLMMTPGRSPKTAPPRKALRELAMSSGHMVAALESLPPAAGEVLGFKPAALRGLTANVRILHELAKIAEPGPPSGRPKKPRATEIAEVVAQHYYGLTGEKPTIRMNDGKAYGPFMELSDNAAVRAGRKIAELCPFEVWRGLDRIYGIVDGVARHPFNSVAESPKPTHS